MARKKRQNAPLASSSTTKNSTVNNTSQPNKFGIQHFFDRHSLSQSSKHRDSNDAVSVLKSPPPANAEAAATVNITVSPLPEDATSASRKLTRARMRSKDAESAAPNEAQGLESELENPKKGMTLAKSELICQQQVIPTKNSRIYSVESDENISQFLNSASGKRFKFSPGMLLKQSQDDVADEITWKISPVNERLQTISKNMPEVVKALAESSRCISSDLMECPEDKVGDHLSSLKFKVPGKSDWLLERPGLHSQGQTLNATASDSDANNVHHSGLLATNSPFQTPPSLSYCHEKSSNRMICTKKMQENLTLRPHKKALLELLDQVEDALSHEGSVPSEETTSFQDIPNEFSNGKLAIYQSQGRQSTTESGEEAIPSSCGSSFLVLEVTEKCGLANLPGAQCSAKVLRLVDEHCGKEKSVHLCDDWISSVVAPGDTVHVIGEFDEGGKCIVNRERNFIIVQPQQLISGTRVAGTLSCPRRAVLDERLKFSEVSTAALSGTLLHQIFQAGLLMEASSRETLEEYARIVLQKNIESLYSCGVHENDMLETLLNSIPKILSWIDSFKWCKESQISDVNFEPGPGLKQIVISEVIDIEEMVWAPKYGLKGMIDASLVVRIGSGINETNETIMPLEFKTGKSTEEHSAQVILYTLLMSERYSEDIDTALLYYLQTNKTQGKSVRRSDLVGLIMRRNELAHDILKALAVQQLPPMLQNPSMCRGCRHLDNCTVYHKMHGGNSQSSGLGEEFDARTAHLTMSHISFFELWNKLIDLEAKEIQFSAGSMWQSNLFKGQSSLSCLRSLVLDASHERRPHNPDKDRRFVYHFMRRDRTGLDMMKNELSSRNDSFQLQNDLDCTLRSGDRVILSIESSCLAVANGVIKDISQSLVSVSFSKRLRIHRGTASLMSTDLVQQVWRIDKDETVSSFAIMRYNLVHLFRRESDSMRKKIVDLEAPRFDGSSVLSQDPAISYIWSESNLNDDQRKAIVKILNAKDYALILGMPGTGKTSTMVYAIKALLMRGASILLTSYTNSAVDNLLIKLKAQGIDFVRLGRTEVVHSEVQGHCISGMEIHSVDEMRRRMHEVKVIGVTCLGITSPLLANRKFDVCIMDEAGQISLPVSLGPLMFASKFVLVGDHYQLPPLVQSAEARENGMGVSLFCRLSEAHPQAISALQNQYRMSEGIMNLSNALIYGDRLLCGASHVKSSVLRLARLGTIAPWIGEVLNEQNSVIFINTDILPAIEEKENKTVHNRLEAFIVAEIVGTLVGNGIKEEDIGVITPYNSQASLIRHAISMTHVEVHTIDKYQGRDKDCILISFVRSSRKPSNLSSSLLGDWHRMNVALTRAKKKLIMVGSCKTLSRIPLMKLLIEKVNEQSGILHITNDDIEASGGHKKISGQVSRP